MLRSKHRIWDGEGITLAILILWAISLLALPLLSLGQVALTLDGSFSLEPILSVLDSRSAHRAFFNSLESSALSALGAVFLGTVLALAVGLCDIRLKGVIVFLILLPMMIPPHVTAISWIQALGPASPILQWLGIAPPPGSTHPLYSKWGVMFLLTLQHAPLVFLIIRAALRTLPREMVEAGRIAGAQPWLVLRRIILPLLLPSLIAGFALAFVAALGNFGIPALLGIPARYTTLPVLIWQRLASFGPSVLNDMAAIASVVAVIAIVAVLVQSHLQARARNALIGLPQQALAISLGRWRPLVEGGIWSVIAASLVLPLASLLAISLVKTYGLPLTWSSLTLGNYDEILFQQAVTIRAFVNSTIVAGGVAILLAGIAGLVGFYATHRDNRTFRRIGAVIAGLGDVTYAIPGLVISVAFILTFLKPLPILGISLYGTLWILVVAYLCAFFSVAFKSVGAAYQQLDPALDDAARVSGARFGLRLRKIFLPLIAPAAASGAILVFLTAYNEITVSALLWSAGNETIGTTIFNYEDGGYTTLAAAMSFLTVIVTVLLMAVLDRMGRYLPDGAVPWR